MLYTLIDDIHMLAYSVVLAWLMILTAALMGIGSLKVGFSNRQDMPVRSAVAGRADRAARNMLENLVLFGCAWGATRAAGVSSWRVIGGAQLFFVARAAYWPVYLAGIPYLRTLLWLLGVVGVGLIVSAAIG